MQDFKMEQDNFGDFDIVIDEDRKDFDFVDGMDTAVDFQLFIDKRVSKQDEAIPRQRQGWIGDLMTKASEGYEVGSLLWLKRQARDTALDKNETAGFARKALEYFVAINAAKKVNARVVGEDIEGEIEISDDNITRYNRLWRATNAVSN